MPRPSNKPRICRQCKHAHRNRVVRHCVQCGHEMWRPRWRMTTRRISAIHAKAMGQKGLSEETYRLRLERHGIESCKQMNRETYNTFLRELDSLPDKQGWKDRRRAA